MKHCTVMLICIAEQEGFHVLIKKDKDQVLNIGKHESKDAEHDIEYCIDLLHW